MSWRTYFKASCACGSHTHQRIVLRDRPVSRAISCKDLLSRKYSRLILPKISMVITFFLLPKIQAEPVKHLGQFWLSANTILRQLEDDRAEIRHLAGGSRASGEGDCVGDPGAERAAGRDARSLNGYATGS